ncbi:MAG: succinate dehydrogenase cytochrome b subunit [Longimicrobiales bacterium]
MSTTATPAPARAAALYRTTVGKKIAMAVSGLVLLVFVIGHFIGNLKVYQGQEAFNHYAEGLRTFGSPFFGNGQLLWLVRLGLFAALVIHIASAVQLVRRSRAARPVPYREYESLAFSYASRTMVWGGLIILAFVLYHLLHLTFGTVHPDFVPGDAYHNFILGFRSWPVALAYIAAMIPLGFHLYHGLWSALQTVGVNNPHYNRYRRPLALGIALAVTIGNVTFPLAVATGLIGAGA